MQVRAGSIHDVHALAAPRMRRRESRTLALQCFRSEMAGPSPGLICQQRPCDFWCGLPT